MTDRSDTEQPEPGGPDPDLSRLPRVLEVAAVLRRYRKPRYRVRRGPTVEEVKQAVEITLETDGPFAERALGPVLLVGRVEISESERIGPNRYRFYAYDVDRLEEGSRIRLGWFGQPRPRRDTGFRLELGGKR